jgi:hypothetical protein
LRGGHSAALGMRLVARFAACCRTALGAGCGGGQHDDEGENPIHAVMIGCDAKEFRGGTRDEWLRLPSGSLARP